MKVRCTLTKNLSRFGTEKWRVAAESSKLMIPKNPNSQDAGMLLTVDTCVDCNASYNVILVMSCRTRMSAKQDAS